MRAALFSGQGSTREGDHEEYVSILSNGRTYYPYWPNASAKPAISLSSESAYIECPRRWFNEYNNRLLPTLEGKRIRAEKPLITGPMLTGAVAHDVIEAAIVRYKRTGETPEAQLQDVRGVCRERIRQYYKFSQLWAEAAQNGRTVPRPRGLSPMETIFRGFTLTPEEGKSLLDAAETCVSNFLRSPVYQRILRQPPENVLVQSHEPLHDGSERAFPWYWAGENPVYASYDLILLETGEEGETQAVVVDWKTGSRDKGEDKVERQLNYYAPLVAEEYGVPYDQIELVAAWIGDGAGVSSFESDPTFVNRHMEKWKAWREDLRLRTAAVEKDPERLDELFPMTSNLYRCRFCKYQSCPGQGRTATQEKLAGGAAYYVEPADSEEDYLL